MLYPLLSSIFFYGQNFGDSLTRHFQELFSLSSRYVFQINP